MTICMREKTPLLIVEACKLLCCPVLIVEAAVVDYHPIAFLDLLWPEPVRSVEPGFVPYPRHSKFLRGLFHVLLSSLELSYTRC